MPFSVQGPFPKKSSFCCSFHVKFLYVAICFIIFGNLSVTRREKFSPFQVAERLPNIVTDRYLNFFYMKRTKKGIRLPSLLYFYGSDQQLFNVNDFYGNQ